MRASIILTLYIIQDSGRARSARPLAESALEEGRTNQTMGFNPESSGRDRATGKPPNCRLMISSCQFFTLYPTNSLENETEGLTGGERLLGCFTGNPRFWIRPWIPRNTPTHISAIIDGWRMTLMLWVIRQHGGE